MIIDEKKYPRLTLADLLDAKHTLLLFDESDKCFYALHDFTLFNFSNSYPINFNVPDTYSHLRVFLREERQAPYTLNLAMRGQPLSYRNTVFERVVDDKKADFFVFGIPYVRTSVECPDTVIDLSYVKQWAIIASTFYGNCMSELHFDSVLTDLYAPKQEQPREKKDLKELESNWFKKLLGK